MLMKYFKYKFFNLNRVSTGNYKIDFIGLEDIEKIRIWRNKQIKYLRQKKILKKKDQEEYFFNKIYKETKKKRPDLILFAFKKENVIIGYGGYTNISWKKNETELSFLLDHNRSKKIKNYIKEFNIYLNLVKKNTKKIGFNKLISFTFVSRKTHIKVLENFGFIKEKKVIDKSKKDYCFKHFLNITSD